MNTLQGKKIVLGITGSIAAYKAAVLTRGLIKKGAEVQIVITPAGKEFITGVTRQEESFWLLDFWGKKDVAGLLLMPPTRHVMLHLNDCFRWKEEIRTKKKFFLV